MERGANRPELAWDLTAIVPERSKRGGNPKGRGCERGREALQVQGGRRTEERGEVGGEEEEERKKKKRKEKRRKKERGREKGIEEERQWRE